MNFLQAPLHVLLIFLLQLGVAGRAVNFARLVLPFLEFFFVHSSWMWVSSARSMTSCTNCGGIKYTPSRSPTTRSPGMTVTPDDAHRGIDAGQHHVPDRRGIDRAEGGRHVNLRNSFQVTDTAVHRQASAVSGFCHIKEEIVTNDGPVHFLSKRSTISTSPGRSMSMAV